MKKMKIEKQLIFADQVQRIVSLQVSEHLTYRHEDDGIRAMGPLYIKGTYEGNDGVESFQETLEMDVLAPQDKLSGEDFHLQIGDYQGNVQDDTINVMVTMDIYGLKEAQEQKQDTKQKQNASSAVPSIDATQEEVIAIPASQANPKQVEPKKEPTEKQRPFTVPTITMPQTKVNDPSEDDDTSEPATAKEIDGFDDLFSDAESTYTSYRIIVAKPNDTYTGIASRYDVDETALRDTNKNKDILPKTLVILPFQQN